MKVHVTRFEKLFLPIFILVILSFVWLSESVRLENYEILAEDQIAEIETSQKENIDQVCEINTIGESCSGRILKLKNNIQQGLILNIKTELLLIGNDNSTKTSESFSVSKTKLSLRNNQRNEIKNSANIDLHNEIYNPIQGKDEKKTEDVKKKDEKKKEEGKKDENEDEKKMEEGKKKDEREDEKKENKEKQEEKIELPKFEIKDSNSSTGNFATNTTISANIESLTNGGIPLDKNSRKNSEFLQIKDLKEKVTNQTKDPLSLNNNTEEYFKESSFITNITENSTQFDNFNNTILSNFTNDSSNSTVLKNNQNEIEEQPNKDQMKIDSVNNTGVSAKNLNEKRHHILIDDHNDKKQLESINSTKQEQISFDLDNYVIMYNITSSENGAQRYILIINEDEIILVNTLLDDIAPHISHYTNTNKLPLFMEATLDGIHKAINVNNKKTTTIRTNIKKYFNNQKELIGENKKVNKKKSNDFVGTVSKFKIPIELFPLNKNQMVIDIDLVQSNISLFAYIKLETASNNPNEILRLSTTLAVSSLGVEDTANTVNVQVKDENKVNILPSLFTLKENLENVDENNVNNTMSPNYEISKHPIQKSFWKSILKTH
ncbi:putative integral membrane protein [Cryptosporidium meleagridis]|uniref:Putative integral membrane protein n=1 Tax=Cryptosporidium meleagridis TaxID=93969 RepID=A0A2P4Z368_9CRYT|nr:putative integral membrane protein [Cryptosporidium meleagridis]